MELREQHVTEQLVIAEPAGTLGEGTTSEFVRSNSARSLADPFDRNTASQRSGVSWCRMAVRLMNRNCRFGRAPE